MSNICVQYYMCELFYDVWLDYVCNNMDTHAEIEMRILSL